MDHNAISQFFKVYILIKKCRSRMHICLLVLACGLLQILRGASSALLYVNKRSSEGTNRYDDLWSVSAKRITIQRTALIIDRH